MDRRLLLLAASLALVLGTGGDAALADRLGGNYRGPGDTYASRNGDQGGDADNPPAPEAGGESPPAPSPGPPGLAQP